MGPLPVTSRGNHYILIVTDLFTKWVEAFPPKETSAGTLENILVDEVVSQYGVPTPIHSDKGENICWGCYRTIELEAILMRQEDQENWDNNTITLPQHSLHTGLPCTMRCNRIHTLFLEFWINTHSTAGCYARITYNTGT